MSGEPELNCYLSGGGSEEEERASPCDIMSHLHEMGGASDGSESGNNPPVFPSSRPPLHEDMEMGGNVSSGSGTDSHGNDSHGNDSHGNESVGSSSGNSKDSELLELELSGSKSSNSQSLSPPSSSNAYSLVSSEQDHPSTSGCSSEQSAKAKTQKELFKTLKKLKLHLPAGKRSKGRASTIHTLRYALRCVKQVKANKDYYQMLMINDSQPPGLDVSSYTFDELNRITSEYTLKNTDSFAVAVSLITGKVVYISEQAAAILHCSKDEFKDRKFVEFLTPQDVSVFYNFTTPYRLPSWRMCIGAESSIADIVQEKSFFCRISGKKEEGDRQYYPFRMTPYLMKVQDPELSEEHFCCLILAERVHSGYEAPRTPADKRIFTTTHTPNCVFQDVDERAVPLLGYLPQDLIGTQVLNHLHPEDRPLMLAVHRKIVQYLGQPFDHSSTRFCTRNGEYVTVDTSWSSFINPWSRKVSFVIGRHKVRTDPVNEDVFSAPAFTDGQILDSDIQEISEQIHKILLQPVHSVGFSGYGSNGCHDQLTTSSETNSNGNNAGHEDRNKDKPRSFQEICKGVQMLKTQDQQASTSKPDPKKEIGLKYSGAKQKDPVVKPGTAAVEEPRDRTLYSYQQISCLDGVIRYLESCNTAVTPKRKCQFSSNTTSSNSEEEKKACDGVKPRPQDPLKTNEKCPSDVVGGALAPLALPTKAESVVSMTSQCSYSSTIVHVGDKKPQPSEIIGDVTKSPAPSAPITVMAPPPAEQGAYRKLGLTKQVLAAHMQKEEQAFLSRCKDLCLTYLQNIRRENPERDEGHRRRVSRPVKPGTSGAEPATRRSGRTRKSKKPRIKNPESSDSAVSQCRLRPPLQGPNQTSWSPSEASQSVFSVPHPAVVPGYSFYPDTLPPAVNLTSGAPPTGAPPTGAPQFPAPMFTPMVALVLPMFPQLGMPARPPFYPEQQPGVDYSSQNPLQPQPTQHNFFFTQQPLQPQQSYAAQQPFTPQHVYVTQNPFQLHAPFTPPHPFQMRLPRQTRTRSYSSTSDPTLPVPESAAEAPSTSPISRTPLLFGSHCSSLLQLDLLQLEEKADSHSTAPPSGSRGNCSTAPERSGDGTADEQQTCCVEDEARSDAFSTSRQLMELLKNEDSESSTGSASRGCHTSNSGTGSSEYFGSVESSEHEQKRGKDSAQHSRYVVQDPLWILMANTNHKTMMTYQVPSRDMEKVLREDRERLRQLQKSQPRFTSDQRRELIDQHPWMRRGSVPKAISVKECLYCEDDAGEMSEMDQESMSHRQEEAGHPVTDCLF